MIKPDEKILKAIYSLEGNHDFEIVKKWIKDSMDNRATRTNREVDDILIKRGQGAFLTLEVLHKYVSNPKHYIASKKNGP